MPWNDQTSNSAGNPKDGGGSGGPQGGPGGPWGGRGPQRPWGQPPRSPQGGENGPDIEDLMRQWRQGLREMFGGGGSGRGGDRSGRRPGAFGLPALAGVLVLGWLASGIYVVDEGERGVVTRLGRYDRTTNPGLHMNLPAPIEARYVVNVTGQRTTEIGFTSQGQRISDNSDESLMITGDRNIVEVHFRVYYNIANPYDFVFRVRDPEIAVRNVAESAMREIIGRRELEPIITTERADVEQEVETLMQSVLDEYQSGVNVLQVELLSAAAPPAVIEAFNDVVNAGQDAETAINNANRETARIVNEAQAYRERVVREATGEAERFLSVYNEYAQNPRVTRDRLYLETMERVYRNADTMVLDTRAGAVPYLPLDQLRSRPAQPAVRAEPQAQPQGGN